MTLTLNNVSTDDTSKTVTIRQETYVLQPSAVRKGYHHVIYATTVDVKQCVNPGCNLTIYAARVVVDRGGGTIDVSGADGHGYAAGDRHDATTTHGYDGDNGHNGEAGGHGSAGGTVTIYAETISGGPLQIVSRGGNGGRGQDGGNGKEGSQPTEQPRARRPELVVVGREFIETGTGRGQWRNVYGWGADVKTLGTDGWGSYLRVAHQVSQGNPGGNGGHAGLAGRSGDGGRGGRIVVGLSNKTAVAITHNVAAGTRGAAAAHGTPAPGSAGGLGGRYMYQANAGGTSIDWSAYDEKKEWDQTWNTKNSTGVFGVHVDHFDNLGVSDFITWEGSYKKLRLRGEPGAPGKAGGYGASGLATKPPIPPASDGTAGSFALEGIDLTGERFRTVPYAYLLMLQRCATSALFNRDSDRGGDILRWLMRMTAAHRNPGANPTEDVVNRARLYYEAEHALLTRDRDDSAGARAARCAYTDIKQYSEFVEKCLGHVSRQEKSLKDFQQAQEKLAEQTTAVAAAIAEVRDHIKHLTGDVVTPGSIVYFTEKEKELKTAISTLDVQLLDYKTELEGMEQRLQAEIDAKIVEKTSLTVWTVLEFVGMAAGVAVNFASAAGGIKDLVGTIKEYYKTTLDLSTVGEILKDGVWNRKFTDLKSDLQTLLETDEWKKVSKQAKAFITSVTDFQAKIAAYQEITDGRKTVGFTLDLLDVQASVLIFDTAKLDLKKQRTDFEAFIVEFLEEYEEAKAWKHLFTGFFDTSETRFDMLAHLADVQAERRALEHQRVVYERNLALLLEQENKLNFHPESVDVDDVRTGMESSVNLGIQQGLERIMDEGRAYTIWTLQSPGFRDIPSRLDVNTLRTAFHDSVWTKINTELSKARPPVHSDFTFAWKREDYARDFAQLEKTGRITLTAPADTSSNIYFLRIVDARVYLRGATVKSGSPFYCVLRHRGVSEFVNKDRKVITCYQDPRTIQFSYVLANGDGGMHPVYDHSGAIEQAFDLSGHPERIRYSPFTTWQIEVPRNHKVGLQTTVYNEDIGLDALEAIELRVSAYFLSNLEAPVPQFKARIVSA